VGAALMAQTFRALLAAHPGYNPKNVLTMHVTTPGQPSHAASGFVTGDDFIALPEQSYQGGAAESSYYRRVLAAMGALPGVRLAAAYATLPDSQGFAIEGRPEPRPGEMQPSVRAVSGRYFETLELPIREGRGISEQDGADSPRVAVLAESVARSFWPEYPRGAGPLGSRVRLRDGAPWLRVAGVCADVKNWFSGQPMPFVYVSSEQEPRREVTLLLRTSGDPVAFAPIARAALRAAGNNPPVYEVKSMEEILAWQSSGVSGASASMEIYALIAFVLAITGIYALTAYSAAQRTHEIGIRMALGAKSGDVLKMVVGQSMRISGAGLAVGFPAALVLSKVVSSVLFNMISLDLATVAALTILLGLSAGLAAYIPARRAAGLDPMEALHHE